MKMREKWFSVHLLSVSVLEGLTILYPRLPFLRQIKQISIASDLPIVGSFIQHSFVHDLRMLFASFVSKNIRAKLFRNSIQYEGCLACR